MIMATLTIFGPLSCNIASAASHHSLERFDIIRSWRRQLRCRGLFTYPLIMPPFKRPWIASINSTIDTVLVAPGPYNESVQFGGKRALLISVADLASMFIQAPQGSAAVVFSG